MVDNKMRSSPESVRAPVGRRLLEGGAERQGRHRNGGEIFDRIVLTREVQDRGPSGLGGRGALPIIEEY